MNASRVRKLKEAPRGSGPVVYWMSRDQRTADNWALLHAQRLALKNRSPLCIVFCLVPQFKNATIHKYEFMLKGLEEVQPSAEHMGIPFFLLTGKPEVQIPRFLKRVAAGFLVTDFSPLRESRRWKDAVAGQVRIPVDEVDAHNVIPCWVASDHLEFAARTIRPKIHRLLGEFLREFPRLRRHPFSWNRKTASAGWEQARKTLKVDRTITSSNRIIPGGKAARKTLREFLKHRFPDYATGRNDPNKRALSNLSPYLHFGQISAQRIALEARKKAKHLRSKEAFLEELIVRRELADNFCSQNPHYDSFEGFPRWAQKTLNEHRYDPRPYLYTLKQFENAETHDDLWNAAQREMVFTGKMHGYMRMYWAKKILEWSDSPETAMQIAIHLNDRYELDGRDPNGYAGIAWSIGGVHDRPWFERPVFGKIRMMTRNGCKSKFDVQAYIRENEGRIKTRAFRK